MIRRAPGPSPGRAGFTLIELLVVITIIVLVSAVTLPVVLPALNRRQVGEAARILQAALVGARDAAIRDNAPRGIRLLPDPVYNGSTTTLAYNRFIPIGTPPDYTTGVAQITLPVGTNFTPYIEAGTAGAGPSNASHPTPLRVDEQLLTPAGIPNERTSWFWNIRVGDKIQLTPGGRYYTVVGPAVINPLNTTTAGQNPEFYVNDGLPGSNTQNTAGALTVGSFTLYPEYLYLVNGQDDPPLGSQVGDGYIDNGWDGYDNNYDPSNIKDDYNEWTMEQEQWLGAELLRLLQSQSLGLPFVPLQYSIMRRPTPTAGAREITLPGGIVIDATSWNSPYGAERSRLPIDPRTLYVDILVNSNGQVVPTSPYSSPTSAGGLPFYHFWLTERSDVHELSDLWGVNASGPPPYNANPNASATPPQTFLLPLPSAFYASNIPLKDERFLVTQFTRTGQITSNSIENFSITDINAPFYTAQLGAREAK